MDGQHFFISGSPPSDKTPIMPPLPPDKYTFMYQHPPDKFGNIFIIFLPKIFTFSQNVVYTLFHVLCKFESKRVIRRGQTRHPNYPFPPDTFLAPLPWTFYFKNTPSPGLYSRKIILSYYYLTMFQVSFLQPPLKLRKSGLTFANKTMPGSLKSH